MNGRATEGENIADLGGMLLGLDAFRKTETYRKNEKIDGYTPLQRFFLGYAYGWMEEARKEALAEHLMLCFTGFSRFASEVAKSQLDNLRIRQQQLMRMRQMVDDGLGILVDSSVPIETFGELLHEAWQNKRSLSPMVTTPEIDQIYDTARDAGAIGGKLLGAGGGGFMLLFAKPENHPEIRERLKNLIHVPFKFEDGGSRVVLYQPNGM